MTYLGAHAPPAAFAPWSLSSAWAYQPKLDGCYAVAQTDAAGRVCSVLSRNAHPIPEAADLLGILAGPPHSVLVGELDAHTEAGVAAARTRGHANLHLFDCLALDGADLRGLPYLERWGSLHRAQSMLEADGLARVHSWRTDSVPHPWWNATVPVARALDSSAFVKPIPRDLRRFPIAPLIRSVTDARELWRSVEAGALEGLVAVRLDARAGAKGAKVKIKITDTLDVRVLASDRGAVRVATRAGTTTRAWRDRPVFEVGSTLGEAPGTVLVVEHHGYYKSGAPRFPRIVRRREDKRL